MLLEGLESYLSQQHGVRNVKTISSSPASAEAISRWEQASGLTLPSDVKSFYTSYGDLQMSWQYSCNKTTEDVGSIHVSSLSDLIIIDTSTLTREERCYYASVLPALSNITVAIFESSALVGQVCLVYKRSPDESGMPVFNGIWLIDLSLDLHKICSTFSEYLRLAIVHLGLPEWQNLLLPNRQLSPTNIIWYEIFLPKRLESDLRGDSCADQSEPFVPKAQVIKLAQPQS